MKNVHGARNLLRRGLCAGFTLIELMVALAVLSIVATIALAGYRRNDVQTQYKRFLDDIRGGLVAARNLAIDDQRRMRVDVTDDGIAIRAFDPTADMWRLVDEKRLGVGAELLSADNASGVRRVCILGLRSGVTAPAYVHEVDPPDACMAGAAQLFFEPDGRLTNLDPSVSDHAGTTIWVVNRDNATRNRTAMVQIFPGGLVRVFDKLDEGDA